jgi:hypothetical protein
MTQMSEFHAQPDRESRSNRLNSQAGSHLARAVHDATGVGVLVSILLATSCVIPPSLSVENQDAGVNSPPAILAIRSDQEALSEPGPFVSTPGSGSLNVQLLDTDVVDTVYVRVFVNYRVDNPTAPRAACTAAPVATAKRSVTCDVRALCLPEDVSSGATLNMTVVAFDRQPLESGEPAHQAMPEGGLSTSKFFFLRCSGSGS